MTNIHRVYESSDIEPSYNDDNTMDYFLGKRWTGATTDSKVDLGEIVRNVDELVVLNDEAHHIHNPKLAWFKSILDIHNKLKQKDKYLSLQVDVTATPKHDNGAIFVQTVCDYPLVEAIWQNVVKHPVLPDGPSRAKLHETQSLNIKLSGTPIIFIWAWRNGERPMQNMKIRQKSSAVCYDRCNG